MKAFLEEYGVVVVAAIIIFIMVGLAPIVGKAIKTGIGDTPNAMTNVAQKKESTLVSGNEFRTKFDEEKGEFDTVKFVKDRSAPETALDYSAAKDGSILGWLEGNVYYISSKNRIMANEDCSSMFEANGPSSNSTKLKQIVFDNFNTSNTTNMKLMFKNNFSLQSLDVSNFDTSNVTNMDGMFMGLNLQKLDLSGFNTSKVTNMSNMFYHCKYVSDLNISSFDTSNVTTMDYMFSHCWTLESLDLTHFDTSKVTRMDGMFDNCQKIKSIDVSSFNTSNVTSMNAMFSCCSQLTDFDVSHFNTSNVTDMGWMFFSNESVSKLDLRNFDTSKVTDMSSMFKYCGSLVDLNVSSFDTSNVTTMKDMFQCQILENLDVTNFTTSKVTNMAGMFAGCLNLTELDLRNFDCSNATVDGDVNYDQYSIFQFDKNLKLVRCRTQNDLNKLSSISSNPEGLQFSL